MTSEVGEITDWMCAVLCNVIAEHVVMLISGSGTNDNIALFQAGM